MTAKDEIGNELEIGDLVETQTPRGDQYLARVIEVREGGLAVVGGRKHNDQRGPQPAQITPALLKLQIIMELQADPREMKFSGVLKLVDPHPPEVKAQFQKAAAAEKLVQ